MRSISPVVSLPPADSIAAKAYALEWSRIEEESRLLLAHYAAAAVPCLVRLGDGELAILRRTHSVGVERRDEVRDALAKQLLAAIGTCSVLGLPDEFNERSHPWRASLLKEIPALNVPTVSAILPLVRPSLTASVVRGKRALWITHNAAVITERLRDLGFCDFYGFEHDREDLHCDGVPPGRTLPYVKPDEYQALLNRICATVDALDFEIAVIGMGAMGKMVAHHLAQRGRQSFDAGCILSAMRSTVDREVFKTRLKQLVWPSPATAVPVAPVPLPSTAGKPLSSKEGQRRVLLVLRSGGEFQASHVLRLSAQLPGCDISVLTDLPASALPWVKVIPLQHDWPGWWSKMEMFRPDIAGTFLYLDLDTVARDLPAEFFSHPRSLAVGFFTQWEKDHGYVMNGWSHYLQSQMMLLHERDRAPIWRQWISDPKRHMREHRGDQDFLTVAGLAAETWQAAFPGRICSYKLNWLKGKNETENPLDAEKMSVICFHGEPRPWKVDGPFAGPIPRPANAVLVGNGPSVLKCEMGARIDRFEEVVRFNACKIAGFEKHVGTRTTTWSTVGGMQPPEYHGTLPARALCIVGNGKEFQSRPETVLRIASHHYDLARKWVQARSRRADVPVLSPHRAS